MVVDGLRNGDRYTFTVTATNTVGAGAASDPSEEVTPADVPAAPGGASGVRGPQKATVSFSAPADNGSPITGYTVTAHDKTNPGDATDGKTVDGSGSPITVNGLTNGHRYTFTVTATNAVGTGPASDPSDEVTPADVPGAPAGVSDVRGPQKATVSFSAPSGNGEPISGYVVTAHDKSSPGDATDGKTVERPESPITVNGLTNGHRYTFTVTATNAVGSGPASDPSDEVTPADAPARRARRLLSEGRTRRPCRLLPRPTTATRSRATPLRRTTSRTRLTPLTARPRPAAPSPVVVDGLRNGDRYTFTVTATNAVGTGPASDPSDEVTPADLPGAPGQVSAVRGPAKATVSFSAPSDNGSPIASYTVTAHDKSDPSHASDGKTVDGSASPVVVDGLRNGDRYTFTVTATNAVGTGLSSDPSDEVTPAGRARGAFGCVGYARRCKGDRAFLGAGLRQRQRDFGLHGHGA